MTNDELRVWLVLVAIAAVGGGGLLWVGKQVLAAVGASGEVKAVLFEFFLLFLAVLYASRTGKRLITIVTKWLEVKRTVPTQKVRAYVFRRDGGQCQRCGSRQNLEIDHIIPLSRGGSNTEKNLQVLCSRCNRSKGNRYVG